MTTPQRTVAFFVYSFSRHTLMKDEYAEKLIDHNNYLCWVYWNLYNKYVDVFTKKVRPMIIMTFIDWIEHGIKKMKQLMLQKIWYCSLQLKILNKTWKSAHSCSKTVHIFFSAFLVDMPYSTLPLSDIPCHLIHITPIYIFLRYLHFLCVDISIFSKNKNCY